MYRRKKYQREQIGAGFTKLTSTYVTIEHDIHVQAAVYVLSPKQCATELHT
jgi:hypothetical protein